MKQIKLQPKMTLIQQKRFMDSLSEEEREDFIDVKIINTKPKFLENGN